MKTRIKRRAAILILAAVLLTSLCPTALAEAEIPKEEVSPYRIVLTAPGGWNSSNSAVIKVSLQDPSGLGWYRIEYRVNDGNWHDCEDLFDHGEAEIAVRENGTFTLRVLDPHGHPFEETAAVRTIDLAAPTVQVEINGDILRVEARDDLSGVAGVQVNSLLFTDPINHVVTVSLDESTARFDQLSIRAFDYAGNFSEPVLLENPNYQEPDSATPEPTKTPKPTRKPAATPEPEPTKCPYGLGGSLIYVPDDGNPTAAPTQVPTPEPIIQTEYIPIGPGMPYKADGNSHTLDVLYSAATNKQFITLQSKNGNTFYLVIDYDKPIDEDAEMYETYFLNLVDEKDLLALMSDEEKADLPTPTPEIIYVTPEPTAVPAPTTVPEPQPSSKSDQQTAILALIAMLVLGAAGTFMLFKNKGNGKKNRADNDFLMDDEDDEAES